MLKHLRWIRNQIAHDEVVEELDEDDLVELQHFHQHLLQGVDPLAQVRISRGQRRKKRPVAPARAARKRGSDGISAGALVAVLVVVVLVVWLIVGMFV